MPTAVCINKNVLIKPIAPPEVSRGGVVLPDGHAPSNRGVVIACRDGEECPVERGNMAVYDWESSTEITIGEDNLVIVPEESLKLKILLSPEERADLVGRKK